MTPRIPPDRSAPPGPRSVRSGSPGRHDPQVDDSAGRQRNTRQRGAVSALLGEVDGFRTAQELHAMLRERGERVGLTTVYRALQTMADAGEVDVTRLPSGEQLFRRCSRGHHHHLVCRGCGRTIEVAGPAVEHWADRIADEHHFVDISHTLEIFGTCPACAGKH